MDDNLHCERKLEKKLHPMNERYPFAPSGSFKT
jgi:hypothetical protein